MILLTTAADRVQVVTDAAVPVGVHASFVDIDGANLITADRKNTAITTATTTDVVLNPGAGLVRNVIVLTVRNAHASTPVGVTVRHTDGTTVVELQKVTLPAGWLLQYADEEGFRVLDATGKLQ